MAISGDVQLASYNGALRRIGSTRLASLTENRKSRRELDSAWENGRAVQKCLQRADWNFALRSAKMDAETGIETEFGWRYAFEIPSDYERLSALGRDEFFRTSLTALEYGVEGDYWLANDEELYARWVSSDPSFGFDSGKWTEGFRDYLECYLAFRVVEVLTGNRQLKADIFSEMRDALKEGKSTDAMEEGTKFRPPGSWVTSRGNRPYRDRVRQLP